MRHISGNGKNTFFWLDNWHPLGPLKSWFGDRIDHNLGRNLSLKVASIIRSNMWFWAWSRNAVIREIMDTMPNTSISNSSQEDSVAWTLTHVSWWRAIWFQRYVPRWAIIQWMATREKDVYHG